MKTLVESILSSNGAGISKTERVMIIAGKALADNFESQGYPIEDQTLSEIHDGRSFELGEIEYSPKNLQDFKNRINNFVKQLKKDVDIYNINVYTLKSGKTVTFEPKDLKSDLNCLYITFDWEHNVYTISSNKIILEYL